LILTCILTVIMAHPIQEYEKTVPVQCKVLEYSDVLPEVSDTYRHIKLDCSKGMSKYYVSNNKINLKTRWVPNTECYNLGEYYE